MLFLLCYNMVFSGFQPKGKQGTKGQKQILEENRGTLNFYLYIISACNVSRKTHQTYREAYWAYKIFVEGLESTL